MKSLLILFFTTSFFSLVFLNCDSGPKVIRSTNDNYRPKESTGIFSSDTKSPTLKDKTTGINQDVHTVIVEEVLPTSKYVYLKVKEGEDNFWIATGKQEVKVGESYFYRGGLLKTNFESKEYNRVFDKVYLVSKLVSSTHGNEKGEIETHSVASKPITKNDKDLTKSKTREINREGSTKIADIVNNPDKFVNKSVQVSGECVKINPNIMGRNWIHLKDGSKDEYDFVVTSEIMVLEGQEVTLVGTLSKDKDFGAGYRYGIIIENATLLP